MKIDRGFGKTPEEGVTQLGKSTSYAEAEVLNKIAEEGIAAGKSTAEIGIEQIHYTWPAVQIVPSWYNVNTLVKMRLVCKTIAKQTVLPDKSVQQELCGGVLEGTPKEILENAAYKYKILCPKCKAEFSRGRRFHIQSDQGRGVAELLYALATQTSFDVELHFPSPLLAPAGPVADTKAQDGAQAGK